MMSLFVQRLTIIHHHGMTTKNSANDWRHYTCRPGFTLMDMDLSWKLFCSVDLSQYKIVLIVPNGFFSIMDTAGGVYGAEPVTWSCVHPSVCPIMRPQPRRAAGLRLSAVRTQPAALLHSDCSQHGTRQQRRLCHVHSWRRKLKSDLIL